VTGFFEEHEFENVGQFGNEQLDLFRQAENSETEERVDAFLVAEIDEVAFGRGRARNGLVGNFDIVSLEHLPEQIRVPRLLDALQRKGTLDQRIIDVGRVRGYHVSGVTLGSKGDAPKGNGTKAVDGAFVEFRPGKLRRFKWTMRIEEGLTEEGLVGLRAVDHASPSRKALGKSFSIEAAAALTGAFAVATFVFHFANAGRYGYQRDELYFISCARHLAWGYVDQPPLIAVVAKIVLTIFGDSLYAIRLVPALAAALTVALTGRLTRRLGGNLFAMGLAMVGIALAPFYLAVGNLLTMNAFEPLLWLGTAYLFLHADEENRPLAWPALGIVAGLGLVNKFSMFFFLGSCIIGIALTRSRRSLRRPGFFVAAAIALTIVAPTLVWQAQQHWPQVQVLRDAAARKNFTAGPLTFYAQQLLMMNPLTAPIWLTGLFVLLFASSAAQLRWYGVAYLVLSLLYVSLDAKVYYLAPIYPVLFAAGAPAIAAWSHRVRPLSVAYAALLFVAGLAIAPEAFPLLPLNAFLRYQQIFDVRGVKMERHPEGKVPQHFADQLGWHTLVAELRRAYDRLPPDQRRKAVIFTRDYGQASAVDFFGPRYGLPRAISGHNNYYLYGTRGASGQVVLSVGVPQAKLATEFRSIRRVGFYHDPYVLPDFNNLPVYLCTHPVEPLALWWPAAKHYI